MIKGQIHQGDITTVNIYAPNIGAPKYIKQTLWDPKAITDNSTIKGTSISPLSAKDRSFKQIINMETLDLNYTLEHIGLTDIHRTFHPKIAEYTIGSSPHGIISGIGHISSVQLLSRVWLSMTPWIIARQASLSITNSWSSLKLTSIELVMPSSHLILCRPLLLLPPIPPNIRVFSNESTLRMRWPKYWSFSFSIIPSKEHPGPIFRMDWLDLLAVQAPSHSPLFLSGGCPWTEGRGPAWVSSSMGGNRWPLEVGRGLWLGGL